jgi:hypothetical protein
MINAKIYCQEIQPDKCPTADIENWYRIKMYLIHGHQAGFGLMMFSKQKRNRNIIILPIHLLLVLI